MKIISVKTLNFKKLISNALKFNEDINILIGSNNSSKTTLLQSIAFGFNLPLDIDENNIANYLIKNGVCEVQIEFILDKKEEWDICFSQIQHLYKDEKFDYYFSFLKNQHIVLRKELNIVDSYVIGQEWDISLLGPKAPFILEKKDIIEKSINKLKDKDFYKVFKAPLFIESSRELLKKENYRPLIEARKDLSINRVREKLYIIKKDNYHKFEKIKTEILKSFPEIIDLDIIYDEEKGEYSLKVVERIKRNEEYIKLESEIYNSGSGTQSLILILANIFLNNSSVILIDEPEIHLHPFLVERFIKIINKICKRNKTQFIITTHSIPLINSVNLDKLFLFKCNKKNNEIEINPIKEKKEIIKVYEEELGFDLKNEIFQYYFRSNLIIFVEGESDEKYLIEFAKNNPNLSKKIDYWPLFEIMGGKWESYKIALTIQKLKNLKHTKKINFIITLDKDEEEKKKLKNYLNEEELFIWNKREIENYLLDIKALNKIVKEKEEKIREDLEKIIDLQKEEIKEKFIHSLFMDWELNKIEEIRDILKKHKKKNIEDYIEDIEKFFTNTFIERKYKLIKEIKNIEEKFSEKWKKEKWNICSGKEVLKKYRQETKYSFNNIDIIKNIEKTPKDILDFWEKVIKIQNK